MNWYEIILGSTIWVIGVYIYIKYKNFHKYKNHNDSFKHKKSKRINQLFTY